MPEIDGISVLAKLQTDPATARIPVILLAAQAISETAMAWPVLVSNVRATCDRADIDRTLRTRLHLAEEHATRDALTGVMNRRGFEGRLAEAMANVTRHHEPLALVMIDLDHFKRINDVYGHVGGDRVLLYFARALRRAVRVGDQAFRYGGEEFALLLPKCEADGALGVVTRVQRDLRDRPISIVDDATEVVRFSAGIATAESKNDYQVQGLVTLADAALYKAKDGGRDRIEVAT
jgi:diguanylate cyclase (GGDEF)-like protein